MASLAEVQAEILKMQKEQDERVEKSQNDMKAFVAELVKQMKGGEVPEGPKTKDKDHDKTVKDKIFDDKFI